MIIYLFYCTKYENWSDNTRQKYDTENQTEKTVMLKIYRIKDMGNAKKIQVVLEW